MTRSNARPEEPKLFDLPLTAPSKAPAEQAHPISEDGQTLDLFPAESRAEHAEEEPSEGPGVSQEPAAPARRSTSASLRDQVAADLLDLGVVLAALATGWLGAVLMGIVPGLRTWPAFVALGLVFSFLYQTIPLAFWGCTPGMARRGLMTRAGDGGRVTFRQAILRWTAWVLTLGLAGLPYLAALSGRLMTDRLSASHTRTTG